MAISVGVPNSILRQSAMAQNDYPNLSFPPRCAAVRAKPVYAYTQGSTGKPSGARVYYPPLRFPQFTLDNLVRNRYGPMPTLWAMRLQSVPTQGCQELSRTENDACTAVATCGDSQHS